MNLLPPLRPSPAALRRIASTGLCLCLLGAACGEDNPAPPDASRADAAEASIPIETRWVSLIDHDAWAEAAPDEDPLAAHQPAEIECDIAGWREENGLLEMDTGRCNYIWLEQPALAGVEEGAQVAMELRHFDLTSPEPAEAHVALLFEGDVEWETRILIPSTGNVLQVQWQAQRALAPGGRIGVHLHNHGQNTWGLVSAEVQVTPPRSSQIDASAPGR